MADTKALFTQRFDAARTAWTAGDEAAAAELLHSAIVAARSDPSLRRELASALFNLGKLSRRLGRAGEVKAEPLLAEALAISEAVFGSEDAALAPVLHELSRLHLQQSQHARAESALQRLLAIARVKGEEHREVAAALCDLAFVKRKRGDDASAEALYRDALRIQENVLEPNHTVTVGTLERLSETCAARGNFAEALALLHRALPAREAALGADHERVLAARTRVARLESQMADAAAAAAVASLMASSIQTVSAPRIASGDAAHSTAVLVDRRSTDAPVHTDSPVPARRNRRALYSSAGGAAVAIAIAVLLMFHPRAGSSEEPVSAEISAARRMTTGDAPLVTAPSTQTVSNGTAVATLVAATHVDSLRAASAAPELRAPRVEVHLAPVNIPTPPAAPSGEAILRSAMERQRAADTDRAETRDEVSRPTAADVVSAHTSPKIIGRPPEPAFPDALLRSGVRGGQVVVRLMVNELGRVEVGSMIVERSDHDLFTEAVRDILPYFRFEPAHTLTPDSKPVPAWVSVPFRFTTRKR